MQSKREWAMGLAWGLGLLAAGTARADTVLDKTYSSSYLYTAVYDYSSAGNARFRSITALPTLGTDVVVDGGNSATTTYNLSGTRFDLRFIQSRSGTQAGSYAEALGELDFVPTDDSTSYALSGSFSFSSPDAVLYSYLRDFDAGTAQEFQVDSHTTFNDSGRPGGTFTVGGTEGQDNYTDPGALSGTLIAGHHYQWYYQAIIQAYPDADAGATASGNLTLSFSDPANAPDANATPLPSTALGGLVLLGGIGFRRFGRSRQYS